MRRCALPFDDGVLVVEGGLLGGVLLDVLLDLRAGEVARVEFVAGRHGFGADERAVFVEQVPAAAHDVQQALDVGVLGGLVEGEAGLVALLPVDFVEQAAGFDEVIDHLALVGRRGRKRRTACQPASTGRGAAAGVIWANRIHALRRIAAGNRQYRRIINPMVTLGPSRRKFIAKIWANYQG